MGRGALARAAAAAVAAGALAASATPVRAAGRPWYAPDHAKLQLAGNIGFLSPGLGYAWGRRLEGDVFFGWVPEAIGGADIFSLTGKLVFAPWTVGSARWSLRPLTAALQVTYTFGDQYFVVPEFEFTPTALRSGIAFGAEARRRAGGRTGGRTVGLYAELVALDLGLVHWLSNGDALGPADVFSLAFGVRVEL